MTAATRPPGERFSDAFGVEGVEIKQTLSSSYDAFRAINVSGSDNADIGMTHNLNSSSFGNGTIKSKTYILESEYELNNQNLDGRIPLGMFCFKNENESSHNFPDGIIPGQMFEVIPKFNLVKNGDCAIIRQTYVKSNRFAENQLQTNSVIFQPAGNWKFMAYDGIGKQSLPQELHYNGETPAVNLPGYQNHFFQNTSGSNNTESDYADDYNRGFTGPSSDGQTSYAGYLPYVPLSTITNNSAKYSEYDTQLEAYYKEMNQSKLLNTYLGFGYPNNYNKTLAEQYDTIGDNTGGTYLNENSNFGGLNWETGSSSHNIVAPIATWIRHPFAVSNNRCLVFHHRAELTTEVAEHYYQSSFPFPARNDDGTYDADGITHNEWNTYVHKQISDEESDDATTEDYIFSTTTTERVDNVGFWPSNMDSNNEPPNCDGGTPPSNYGYYGLFNSTNQWILVGAYDFTADTDGDNVPREGGDFSVMMDEDNLEDPDETHNFINWKQFTSNLFRENASQTTHDDLKNLLKTKDTFKNYYLYVGSELMKITKHIVTKDYYPTMAFFKVTRGFGGTTAAPHTPGEMVKFYPAGTDYNKIIQMSYGGDFYPANQYRTLNQWQTIYREGENFIKPYSVLTIRFKMYTQEKDGPEMPAVETGIFAPTTEFNDGDWYKTIPRVYVPKGGFNSVTAKYTGNEGPGKESDETRPTERYWSRSGTIARFQNSKRGKWETFEYHANLSGEYFKTSTGRIRTLGFIVQAGNDFRGRVLLDDFEVYDSGEFTPDVDVRKRLSVGNYGKADLTKYYDRELQPDEYKDTMVPLEAQFYFYPTYTTDTVFDVIRTPMYNDFRKGLFYIYDVDWGDGSPKEFVSEPEQIDEEKVLLHTYLDSGVFEVRGYMIRMKGDEDGEPIGVYNVKKFKLRICVNTGEAEDFTYFGSEGSAFIPYDKTTPVIGGYSKQSSYYKTIKRQLGMLTAAGLENDLNVKFEYPGDRLKSELALLKMDNSLLNDFKLTPYYKSQRTIGKNTGEIVNNGFQSFTEEIGSTLGDCDIQCIKYYKAPKSLHELLGFESYDLSIVGKANEPRYWKNIIPKGYSITNREDLFLPTDNYGNIHINIYSEQEFPTKNMNLPGNSNYYYPVLPKYGQDGHFIEINYNSDNLMEDNIYPNNNIPFPLNGPITDEFEDGDDLIISITTTDVEKNVFLDVSGNYNFGFAISDYKPFFSNKTLQPKKKKGFGKLYSSNIRGAF